MPSTVSRDLNSNSSRQRTVPREPIHHSILLPTSIFSSFSHILKQLYMPPKPRVSRPTSSSSSDQSIFVSSLDLDNLSISTGLHSLYYQRTKVRAVSSHSNASSSFTSPAKSSQVNRSENQDAHPPQSDLDTELKKISTTWTSTSRT